ncbi:MAG: di-heme enzyme [Gammaproteobacteria bacterium]|jgi:cytochrome c peroxidase|nr:di-heme enzyme [Gammaproteobacteria bacterium]
MARYANHPSLPARTALIGSALLAALLSGCGDGGGDDGTTVTDSTPSQSTSDPVSNGGAAPQTEPTPQDPGRVPAATWEWNLPQGFPMPRIPADNPTTVEGVELGRHLFYDRRLSLNGGRSCADCHQPAKAFTDGLPKAIGITANELHARNSMALANVAYNSAFNWANPNTRTLESQALGVLFNQTPVELGWSDREDEILARLSNDPVYTDLFARAYPDQADPVTTDNVIKALASFQRTMISATSPFDNANRGDAQAMSESAVRGRELFFGERLECFHCHGGFNLSQSVDHEGVAFDQTQFNNNGLYNINGTGAYPTNNTGIWEFTQKDDDMGRFRAPSLRNIELTAPYMHDGSIATLESAVDHYMRGGRLINDGPLAGDGAQNPFKSSLISGFDLTGQEREDLLNFFRSLTDWEFICDPAFSDPFGNLPAHPDCS